MVGHRPPELRRFGQLLCGDLERLSESVVPQQRSVVIDQLRNGVGHTVNDIAYYLLVFVVFSVVGWVCRNINMIPFIFVFLVQEQVESVMIVVYNMYI